MTQHVLIQKIAESKSDTEVLQTYSEEVYDTYDAALKEAQDAWVEGEELIICELTPYTDWERPYCSAQTFRATHLEPAEYCENPALLGSEYCGKHCDERP